VITNRSPTIVDQAVDRQHHKQNANNRHSPATGSRHRSGSDHPWRNHHDVLKSTCSPSGLRAGKIDQSSWQKQQQWQCNKMTLYTVINQYFPVLESPLKYLQSLIIMTTTIKIIITSACKVPAIRQKHQDEQQWYGIDKLFKRSVVRRH